MIGGKKIHEKWLSENIPKKMKAVALFKSDTKMEDIPRCAKSIMTKLGLSKTTKKGKKELPIWIQELELKNKYYYLIFVALEIGKLYSYNLNRNRTMLKSVECLSGMRDITNNKRSIGVLYTAIIKTKKNDSTNSYLKNKNFLNSLNSLNLLKTLSPSSKPFVPKSQQQGGYVKIQGGGTRKVRYQKNGKAYILLNGKKVKL